MYTGVHLNVSWETHSFELFDLKIELLVENSVSLSTVVLNSRIDKENYGFPNFHTSNNHLKTDFC